MLFYFLISVALQYFFELSFLCISILNTCMISQTVNFTANGNTITTLFIGLQTNQAMKLYQMQIGLASLIVFILLDSTDTCPFRSLMLPDIY